MRLIKLIKFILYLTFIYLFCISSCQNVYICFYLYITSCLYPLFCYTIAISFLTSLTNAPEYIFLLSVYNELQLHLNKFTLAI